MKLVTFSGAGADHIGALLDDGRTIADFTASDSSPWARDMLALIDGGDAALGAARALVKAPKATVQLSSVKLRAPLPEPRQMRDFLSFEKHVRQARAHRHLFGVQGATRDPAKVEIPPIWHQQPIYYKCNRFAVIGHGEDIRWPSYSKMMDYELEFGIVLGRTAKNVARQDARSYIFGYTIFNDVSARDAQIAEMAGQLGPCKGKDFDTGNVLGPWLVTADEIPDPYSLDMIVRVNGEERGRGSSRDMQFRFEDFIAHVSRDETVRAGEFFGSGTVGNGSGLEFGRFLDPGDEIEMEVTGLGTLRNRLVKP
jgi:2-keto-4-pentenoate hydratase/2-oxohepta-3-ene-1,7-dioic acid hydratase in catechol pathway